MIKEAKVVKKNYLKPETKSIELDSKLSILQSSNQLDNDVDGDAGIKRYSLDIFEDIY